MGLVIKGSKVLVDHGSKEHLVTTPEGNPKRYTVKNAFGELDVFSVFTRLKASSRARKDRAGRMVGDNCPLIYALKGREGLTTGYQSIRELLISGTAIIRAFQPEGDEVLVPAPSSHPLVSYMTRILSAELKLQVADSLLCKSSVQSVVADLNAAIEVATSYQVRKDLRNTVHKLQRQEVFALKEVPTTYRELIRPFEVGVGKLPDGQRRVVLVDDLVASGTSLIGAMRVLKDHYPKAEFRAITLFSNV